MVEFTVIGPIITLLGLSMLQYGLLFFAKNHYNHAVFMAARAGSTGHANLDTIKRAYATALVPLYGGGTTATALTASYQRALADIQANAQIDMLNPTVESFSDFNSPALQARYGLRSDQHVIPNSGQAFKPASFIAPASGQNIQDANLLKLRITMGYKPQVPLVGSIYTSYLKWLDSGTNPTLTTMINAGRIPVVSHVTVQMQSDAIKDIAISVPGPGNGGQPINPGAPPPVTTPPPTCNTPGCTLPPTEPGGGGAGPGGPCPKPTPT